MFWSSISHIDNLGELDDGMHKPQNLIQAINPVYSLHKDGELLFNERCLQCTWFSCSGKTSWACQSTILQQRWWITNHGSGTLFSCCMASWNGTSKWSCFYRTFVFFKTHFPWKTVEKRTLTERYESMLYQPLRSVDYDILTLTLSDMKLSRRPSILVSYCRSETAWWLITRCRLPCRQIWSGKWSYRSSWTSRPYY